MPQHPQRSLLDNSPIPVIFQLEARFTAQQWAENYEAQQKGLELPFVTEAKIIYTDRRDEGVVDIYRLRLTGCPIEPVPELGQAWRQNLTRTPDGGLPREVIDFEVNPPRERQYWISRSQGIPLPSPAYGDPPSAWNRIAQWYRTRQTRTALAAQGAAGGLSSRPTSGGN